MPVVDVLIENIDQVSIKLHNGTPLTVRCSSEPSADANTSDRGRALISFSSMFFTSTGRASKLRW